MTLWKNTKDSIKVFLSDESKVPVTIHESTWKASLMGDYIYIDYGAHYSTEFLSQNYSCDYHTQKYVFSSLIIKPPDPYGEQYTFLFHDILTGKYYQFFISSSKMHLLPSEYMDALSDNQNKSFSFELNLDKPASDDTPATSTQKVFINSMVLLDLDSTTKPEVKSVNPLVTNKGILDEKMMSTVATLFNVNPHTMRKFTDEDGSVTFVENYAVLKIHADGYIEYKVTNENTAPALPSLTNSNFGTIYAAANFIDSVIRAAGCQNELISNTDVIDNPQNGNANLSFNYTINATPVDISLPSSSHGKLENAIEVQIKNNKLVSYQQYLRNYNIENATTKIESSVIALNKLLTYKSLKFPIQISDMYPIYFDDTKNSVLNARWFVSLENGQDIVLN